MYVDAESWGFLLNSCFKASAFYICLFWNSSAWFRGFIIWNVVLFWVGRVFCIKYVWLAYECCVLQPAWTYKIMV